jgi:hypothetical protein
MHLSWGLLNKNESAIPLIAHIYLNFTLREFRELSSQDPSSALTRPPAF